MCCLSTANSCARNPVSHTRSKVRDVVHFNTLFRVVFVLDRTSDDHVEVCVWIATEVIGVTNRENVPGRLIECSKRMLMVRVFVFTLFSQLAFGGHWLFPSWRLPCVGSGSSALKICVLTCRSAPVAFEQPKFYPFPRVKTYANKFTDKRNTHYNLSKFSTCSLVGTKTDVPEHPRQRVAPTPPRSRVVLSCDTNRTTAISTCTGYQYTPHHEIFEFCG